MPDKNPGVNPTSQPGYKGYRGDSAQELRRMEREAGAPYGSNKFALFHGFPLPHPEQRGDQRPGVPASPLPASTELADIYDNIVQGWGWGSFANTEAVVQELMSRIGISRDQALGHYETLRSRLAGAPGIGEGGGPTGTTPQAGRPSHAPGDVPVAQPFPVPRPLPEGLEPEAFGRRAQYNVSRGLPSSGGGPAGAYGRSLFDPYQDVFGLQSKFRGVFGEGDEEERTFAQYLQENTGGISGTRQRARDLLSRLFNTTGAAREKEGLGFGNVYDEDGVLVRGARVSDTDQENLFYNALRGGFGRRGAAHIVGRLGQTRDQFAQSQLEGSNSFDNFLDYFRDRYQIR